MNDYRSARYHPILRWLSCICLVVCLTGCTHQSNIPPHTAPNVETATSTTESALSLSTVSTVSFVDVAKQVGIDFHHINGAMEKNNKKNKKNMPETVGSGVAFLDYDNDGWQDILILNGTCWPDDKNSGVRGTPHLYHNNGDGTFTDVTKEAGLDIEMYGMGVAIGDFDNDGYEDIYLTALGANHLLRNTLGDRHSERHNSGHKSSYNSTHKDGHNGRKRPLFEEVTTRAGVAGVPMPGTDLKWKWSTSAAWLDYDRDGRLDLFVCQYLIWNPALNPFCGHNSIRGYCPPGTFEPTYCTLYHNEGNGKFRDVSEETGIRGTVLGKALGVAVADFNGDGWPDIVVSNDTWANYLFINQRGTHFQNLAVESGIATSENGHYKAGMGIDTADWRNDGRAAILIGNFAQEGLSLYEPDPNLPQQLLFTDNAHATGLASPSLPFLTFGLCFFDYDLDGWQDLFTANGHVDDIVSTYDSLLTFKERPLLFHNQHNGTFKEVGTTSGLTARLVGRGAACGDFDNDGDLDIGVVDNGGQFRLYRNDLIHKGSDPQTSPHWIRFRTEGVKSNRDGIGARVQITAGGVIQTQWVHSGGSFLSESQRQLTFGLGKADRIETVRVTWPSGIIDETHNLPTNLQYLIREGKSATSDPRTRFLQKGR